MSSRCGKLEMCDRCHATVFLETIGDGERDGGYTRWNKFEPAPKGWSYSYDLQKTLCPECTGKFQEMLVKFFTNCGADMRTARDPENGEWKEGE